MVDPARQGLINVETHSLYADLDPNAPEVLQWKQAKFTRFLNYVNRRTTLAYTDIREQYNLDRKRERYGVERISISLDAWFQVGIYERKLQAIKVYTTEFYWVMSLLALSIDLLFVFAYLFEYF